MRSIGYSKVARGGGAALVLFLGCGPSGSGYHGNPPPENQDLVIVFPPGDEAGTPPPENDLAMPPPQPNVCGDTDPSCTDVVFDPMAMKKFPLPGDMPADPNQSSNGVGRDGDGYLTLDQTHATFDFAWTANTDDWQKGTVSKFDTKSVREVARYFTTTCFSNPGGSKADCDGKNGCCARDSYPQWQNRKQMAPAGPFQQVEKSHINYPSRTAIDFDGSVWVANRALYQSGAQSSVTKIAADPAKCIDYNQDGQIQTSKDVNGDGIIQTDCNGDSLPDDISGVKNKPCTNGMAQEFYGLDDECILMTTNTGGLDAYGRPLALGAGAMDFSPSDVWAGLFNTKQVFRIDGSTGLYKDEVALPCAPYGFVVDSTAIGWAANLGAGGCYWDTKNTGMTGMIRTTGGQSSYGIGIDRDQNIWFGGTAARYTPKRGGQFADLGQGYWTVFSGIGGSGVAVDSRTPNAYFAYFAGGQLYQVPASTIPLPVGQDMMVNAANFPTVPVFGGGGKGVDIAADGNVMVTSGGTAGIQRVKVDAMGVMSKPDLMSPPMGNNKCPSGDYCSNLDHGSMSPYTYSDFTGFGLRNYTLPKGSWTYVMQGCVDTSDPKNPKPGDTKWLTLSYQADTPPNTTVTLRVRSGNTAMPDLSWGAWSADQKSSPIDLQKALSPNLLPGMMGKANDGYFQVEVDLTTGDKNAAPKLRRLDVTYECPTTVPVGEDGGIG